MAPRTLPEVALTAEDQATVAKAAKARMEHAIQHNRNAHGRVGRDLSQEVKAAAAELAVARYLGLPWASAPGTYRHKADVGELAEVKMIDKPPAGEHTRGRRLLIREADVTTYRHRAYFLVWALSDSRFAIVGWVWGHEAEALGGWEVTTPGRPASLLVHPLKMREAWTAKGVVR